MEFSGKGPAEDWQLVLQRSLDARDAQQILPYKMIFSDYAIQLEANRALSHELIRAQEREGVKECEQGIEEPGDLEDDSEEANLRRQIHRLQQKQLELHQDKAESVELITRLRGAFSGIESELSVKDAEIEKLKQELAMRSFTGRGDSDEDQRATPAAFQFQFVEHFETPPQESRPDKAQRD